MNRRKVYVVNKVSFKLPAVVHESNEDEEEEEEEEEDDVFSDYDPDHSCDWFGRRPLKCQPWANMRTALLLISSCALVVGMSSIGLINGLVETAENRFSINSKRGAIISSAYHLGILLTVLPISYAGSSRRKPRFLGVGMGIVAFACILFCLPAALERHNPRLPRFSNSTRLLCPAPPEKPEGKCQGIGDKVMWLFWVASFLLGVGSAPVLSLGISYIDENSSDWSSPFLISVFYFGYLLGVAGGFGLTSGYENPKDGPSSQNKDISSIWWIGFICMAFVSLLLAFLVTGLPTKLVRSENDDKEQQKVKEKEQAKDDDKSPRQRQRRPSEAHFDTEFLSSRIAMTCSDLGPNLKIICLNPAFVCVSFSMAARTAFLSGIMTFGTKFVDTTFKRDESFNFVLASIYAIPASIVGIFIGATFIVYSKFSILGVLRAMIVVSLFTLMTLFLFLMRCSSYEDGTPPYIGLTASYDKWNRDYLVTPQLDDECHRNCSCDPMHQLFVCGADGRNYYSPCHAGCRSVNEMGTMFGNCSCIESSLKDHYLFQATRGPCQIRCLYFWLFQILFICMIFLNCCMIIPHLSVTLRCVPEKQRTLALGIQWFLLTLFGTVPGPLIFGTVIDRACVWWLDSCARSSGPEPGGSCVLYHELRLRFTILIISFITNGLVSLFLVVAVMIYRPPVIVRSLEMYLNWQDRRLSVCAPPGRLSVTRQMSIAEASEPAPPPRETGLTAPFRILRFYSEEGDSDSERTSQRKRQLSAPSLCFEEALAAGVGRVRPERARRTKSMGCARDGRGARFRPGADAEEGAALGGAASQEGVDNLAFIETLPVASPGSSHATSPSEASYAMAASEASYAMAASEASSDGGIYSDFEETRL